MGIYLERKVYGQLQAWKNKSNHSTLEVSGARQVGKTYIVNKFADEAYQNKVYVNLLDFSGEMFLERYRDLRREMREGKEIENPVHELLKRYRPDFADSKDTVVIIDEIQESAEIYNRIREFTRNLESDFIITGSYLGRVLNKEFKYSAGDLDSLEVQTLSFEEFLEALGEKDVYDGLDLYGNSGAGDYQKLEELFRVYCKIGGYPAVVLKYLETRSQEECQAELLKIIHLFIHESRRYFEDILDDAAYENMFSGIARILAKEKKGFEEDSFSEELQGIVVKDYSSNISKASVNRAIDWLYSSGIVGFAGKLPECRILDFKAKARCYFMDTGLAAYFLTKIGCPEGTVSGILNENFVYLDLKRRTAHPFEIALETPAFATLGNGEIDFYVKGIKSQKTYAVEVKAGKQSGRTAREALEKRKADAVLYAKGNTKGGKADNIYTIPIYAIAKFHF
jgi:hypothetical protein